VVAALERLEASMSIELASRYRALSRALSSPEYLGPNWWKADAQAAATDNVQADEPAPPPPPKSPPRKKESGFFGFPYAGRLDLT
jgi:hypothetical protein